jgi:hypothetical protein
MLHSKIPPLKTTFENYPLENPFFNLLRFIKMKLSHFCIHSNFKFVLIRDVSSLKYFINDSFLAVIVRKKPVHVYL